MTRKEAIKVLKKDLKIIDDPKVTMTAREWEEHDDHMRDALEMAIQVLEQEPEQRHWVGTPKEFAEKMSHLAGSGDEEADHVKADELMCQLLTSLGYGEGVKIFRDMDKWYS